ncbi:MAG: DUF1476 family protein [Alphaproteobacteria bacterium]|nr:DUF1476 family protein [Alphaproteobacteria bacterium]
MTARSAFDERRDAFEREFAHAEELAFKARARASHDFGLWAAGELRLMEAEAERYAAALRAREVQTGSLARVFEQVRADFHASGLPHSDTWLRRRLNDTLAAVEARTRRDG